MKKERLLILPVLLLLSLCLRAQTYTITGIVRNSKTGEALDGVTIAVDNLKTAVTTRPDGTYSIRVDAGSKELSFSFVGFAKQSLGIDGRHTIDITLSPDNGSLNDVVVIGYG